MAALVDTNVLVYVHDRRFPDKQRRAKEVLDRGVRDGTLRVPHQAVLEFVAVATRTPKGGKPILQREAALRKADALLRAFEILYPNPTVVRTALGGAALYRLPWYDAHLWAYAEAYGIPEILSEDFRNGAVYGSVRIANPFL